MAQPYDARRCGECDDFVFSNTVVGYCTLYNLFNIPSTSKNCDNKQLQKVLKGDKIYKTIVKNARTNPAIADNLISFGITIVDNNGNFNYEMFLEQIKNTYTYLFTTGEKRKARTLLKIIEKLVGEHNYRILMSDIFYDSDYDPYKKWH